MDSPLFPDNYTVFFLILAAVNIFVIFFFLPTILAALLKHKNVPALFALNLILGFTIIGWAVALVWALLREQRVIPPSGARIAVIWGLLLFLGGSCSVGVYTGISLIEGSPLN